MGGYVFIAVLSDSPEKREEFCRLLGKETGKDDISFYAVNFGGKIRSLVEPTMYPQKVHPLAYSLYIADYVVVLADQLNQYTGEIIVALDALGKENGLLVTSLELPVKGTVVEKYGKVEEVEAAREKVLALSEEPSAEGELLAFVDKYLSVKSVGNVALGGVKEGKMNKRDKLVYLPGKVDVEVRSLQINDKDSESASAGERFGIAYKGEPIDRGMLVGIRSGFSNSKEIMGDFRQSPFYKDDISRKLSFCYGMNTVEGRVQDNSVSLDRELPVRKRNPLLVMDPSNQKLRIVGSFTPI